MLASLFLSVACLAYGDEGSAANPSLPVTRPHQAESGELVRDALRSEMEGRDADRLTQLARAIALDPGNTLARALMGLVEFRGRWQRPEAVAKSNVDPDREAKLREYLTKRASTPMKADPQVRLADWCAKNGLEEQARAHYRAAVQIDPAKESAWRHLGFEKKGNRWVRSEDLAAEKAEAEARKKADRYWRPRIERIRDGLSNSDRGRRDAAERELAAVRDPRAVPLVVSLLVFGRETSQLAAVQALNQIDGPFASEWIARLAILSDSERVRLKAASALLTRDPREVVGPLIGMIRRPFHYKVVTGNGPGTEAQLLVDGEAFDLRRIYRYPDLRDLGPRPYEVRIDNPILDPVPTRANVEIAKTMHFMNGSRIAEAENIPAMNEARLEIAKQETIRRNMDTQERLDNDVRNIEDLNAGIEAIDNRTLPLLRMLTGRDYGKDPDAWQGWWANELGLAMASSQPTAKPTYMDSVEMTDVTFSADVPFVRIYTFSLSCFAAGTPVITVEGPRAVDSIQVGDMVLSQDVKLGTLSYRPVIATHRNAPAPTLRIIAEDETIIATGIHRFWKVGQGWTMARDLKPGDRLRMAGTSTVVESIRPDARQPVYNLDVEGNRNFFVGNRGLLVNDFSIVDPIEVPFDGLRTPTSLVGNP